MKNTSPIQAQPNYSDQIFNKPWDYAQLAEFLSMSPASLRVWVMQGKLPYYKIGKLVRFDPPSIKAWLEIHTVKAGGGK